MKSEAIRKLLREMRERNSPDVDGSYILCAPLAHPDYAAAAHPAYTPKQIEAEAVARKRPNVSFVYFIRDEQRQAPYWLSPGRQRDIRVEGKTESGDPVIFSIRHIIIDVARSREDRKNGVEVAIPIGQLQAMQQPKEQEAFVLEYVRKAIATVLQPTTAAA